MKSISWPNMFKTSKTILLEDKEAAINNLKLLLKSFKLELFGDPQFGTSINKYFFEQNCIWIRDLVSDAVYEAILTYMPLLAVSRKDIIVESSGVTLYVTINFTYYKDKLNDSIKISLLDQ